MVTYFNPSAMYRHQQALAAQNAQFHHGSSPISTWYAGGYHHQGAPQHPAGAPTPSYCMQDEQQMWHHPTPHHSIFQQEYPDVLHAGIPSLHHQQVLDPESQLPSPPITVSGSDMSSPGAGNGNGTSSPPTSRPPPARSPYEWIKKNSYQSQPNPGKTRTKDKYRVVYTDHQRLELEKEFTFNNKYITIRRKSELASALGLSERQVKIWFQNRRAKERKQVKKRMEEVRQKDNNPVDPLHLDHHPDNMAQMHHHHQQQHHHTRQFKTEIHEILPTPVPAVHMV